MISVLSASGSLHGIEDAADLVIDMGAVSGEDFHHAGVERFWSALSGSHAGRPAGRGVSLASRNDAEFLLPLESLLAIAVPAHVELAFEFVDPLLRRLVRGVGGARRDIEEEGRSGSMLSPSAPRRSLVGEVGGEVIVRVVRPRDEVAVLVEDRLVWLVSPPLKP